MSDSESILTEDFATKFQETQEKLSIKDIPMKLLTSENAPVTKPAPTINYGLFHKPKPRDTDSIRTEDFQTEFRKSMVQNEENENKWLRGTTLSTGYKPARPAQEVSSPSKESRNITSDAAGTRFRTTGYRSTTTAPYLSQMYNSHEDLSTLPDSASEAGVRPGTAQNVTSPLTRANTFSGATLPLRTMGNLSSIAPMRRDIMSKFLEKYGSSEVGGASSVKRPVIPLSSGLPMKTTKVANSSLIKDPLESSQTQPSWKQQIGLRHSIAVPRPSVSPIPELRNFSDDDISAEIRTKSEQIQREIQQERNRKHCNPQTSNDTNSRPSKAKQALLTPRETLDEKMREVDRISQSLREAQQEKQKMTDEMMQMEENLRKQKAEVRLTSKLIQDRRSKAQSVHTELLHAEARRDETQKYLDELNLDMVKKKQQLAELEKTLMQRMQEVKSMEDLGLTKDEIESVIAERNELYEIIKLSEESENQKYELEKQLTLAREDLTIEQRRYRERIETLEEELEASMEKISALQSDREELILRLETVEMKFQATEADIEALSAENRRLAQENSQCKQTNSQLQTEQETKQTHLRQQVDEFQQENQQLRNDLNHSKREHQIMRERMQEQQAETEALKERLEELRKSHQARIQALEKDHVKALEQCEDKLRAESQTTITQTRATCETERQEAVDTLKRLYEDQMRQLLQSNRELQDQNDLLQSRVNKQENDIRTLLEENVSDEKMKIRRALNRERERWEEEQEEKWRREVSNLKSETQAVLQAAQNEAQKERDKSKRLQEDLDAALQNLQTVEGNLKGKSEKEKMFEQAKKQMELEKRKELNQMQQECEKAIQSREAALVQKEKALQEFVEQRKAFDVKYLELQTSLRKMGLVVIGEVREECRRLMEAIKMELPKFKHDKENVAVDHVHEAVWDALANLRACAEEFRRSYSETQAERDKLAGLQTSMEEAHKTELAQLTERITEEKSRELADFKDQMLKDHMEEIERLMSSQQSGAQELLLKREQEMYDLRRSMNQWKQETTERIAAQLQREFHVEYERRLETAQMAARPSVNGHHQHRYGDGAEGVSSSSSLQLSSDHNPVQLINQLKKVVQKLREENLSLRKVLMAKNVSEAAPLVLPPHSRECVEDTTLHYARTSLHRNGDQNRPGSSGTRSPPMALDPPLLPDPRRSRDVSSSSKTPTPTPQPRRQTPVKDIKSPEIRSRPQSRSSGSLPLSHHRGSSTPIPTSGSQDVVPN